MSAAHLARLTLAAGRVETAEDARKRSVEQLRSLMRLSGYGPPEGLEGRKLADLAAANGSLPEAKALAQQVALHYEIERIAIKELTTAMRLHPLGEWCKGQVGVGEKTLGRLLGAIGDPATRVDPETGEVVERTLAQLRSYCGYGDPATQRRRKGQQSTWNAEARKRLYLIAVACLKNRASPYRPLYDEARAEWEDRDTSDLHKHNHALRMMVKHPTRGFLRHLHDESCRVQGVLGPHPTNDAADLTGATSGSG